MYELARSLGVRGMAAREALPFGASLAIAELLYKFHSFVLETVAFLATWFLLDALRAFMIQTSLGVRLLATFAHRRSKAPDQVRDAS